MGFRNLKNLIISISCVGFVLPLGAQADVVQDSQSARARSYDQFFQSVYKNPSLSPQELNSAYQSHIVQPNVRVQEAIRSQNQDFVSKQPRLREATTKERMDYREKQYSKSEKSEKNTDKNTAQGSSPEAPQPQRKIASQPSAPSSYSNTEAINRDQQKVNVLSFEGTSKKSQ